MILAVIESDYGTLHLVDRLVPGAREAALEIAIDGSRSFCFLRSDCYKCKIKSQCSIIDRNYRSSEAIVAALSIFGIDKSSSPELFI